MFGLYTRKLGNRRSSEGLRSFKPSNITNLITLLILAGDIEMNPGPRFQCRLCKKYCKASDKVIGCEDCEKRFHASCAKLGDSSHLISSQSLNLEGRRDTIDDVATIPFHPPCLPLPSGNLQTPFPSIP